jgi:hypothetical protein
MFRTIKILSVLSADPCLSAHSSLGYCLATAQKWWLSVATAEPTSRQELRSAQPVARVTFAGTRYRRSGPSSPAGIASHTLLFSNRVLRVCLPSCTRLLTKKFFEQFPSFGLRCVVKHGDELFLIGSGDASIAVGFTFFICGRNCVSYVATACVSAVVSPFQRLLTALVKPINFDFVRTAVCCHYLPQRQLEA